MRTDIEQGLVELVPELLAKRGRQPLGAIVPVLELRRPRAPPQACPCSHTGTGAIRIGPPHLTALVPARHSVPAILLPPRARQSTAVTPQKNGH